MPYRLATRQRSLDCKRRWPYAQDCWDTLNKDLDFEAIGVLVLDENGKFKQRKMGRHHTGTGAGIGFVYYDTDRTQYQQETQVTGTSATGLGQQLIVNTTSKETGWGLAAALMAGVTISFDHRWAIDIGCRAQYLDEVSVDLTPSGQLSKATMGDHWEHQARIGLRANIW